MGVPSMISPTAYEVLETAERNVALSAVPVCRYARKSRRANLKNYEKKISYHSRHLFRQE